MNNFEENKDYYLDDLMGRYDWENRKWDIKENKLIRLNHKGEELYFYDIIKYDSPGYSPLERIITWVKDLFGFNLVKDKQIVELNIIQRFRIYMVLDNMYEGIKYSKKIGEMIHNLDDVIIENGQLKTKPKISEPQSPVTLTDTYKRHKSVIDGVLERKVKAQKERLKSDRVNKLIQEEEIQKKIDKAKFEKLIKEKAKKRRMGSVHVDRINRFFDNNG